MINFKSILIIVMKFQSKIGSGILTLKLRKKLKINFLIHLQSKEDKYEKPSYFQLLTCMAFYTFSKENVKAAIIEVGIGGKYDFTNIIP